MCIRDSDSSGRVLIGTTTEGETTADNLTIADSGHCGMTIRSGTSSEGNIFFSDGTSGDAEYRGMLRYEHNYDAMVIKTATEERLRIDSSGHLHTGYTSSFGDDHVNILATDGGGISIATNNAGDASANDVLGSLSFQGYLNGQTHTNAEAKISGIAAANHTGSSAAADLVFYTKPSSTGPGSAPTERLRITSGGDTIPGADVTYDLGANVNNRWRNIYGQTLNLTSYASVGTIVAADPGSNYYAYNNRIGSGLAVVGTTNLFGALNIDNGTNTLVNITGDSAGTAGLRLGGDATQNQCTGYVEVHQDLSHGGGFFYNGDGSPSFATGEAADYFSLFRLSSGTRHSVMRWFHSSNECQVQGDMLVDNGTSTIIKVRGDSAGTAGVMCGGDNASGQTQCTGYFEAHQDDNYGGGFSYNGDGTPAFVNGETADHITFFRRDAGTRHRVFHYSYHDNAVNFAGNIEYQGSVLNYNSGHVNRGYFTTSTSAQTSTNCPTMAGALHYGFGYQESFSTSGGGWSNPYPDLVLGYHTGMRFGGHPNYDGCRFYADHPSVNTSIILAVGDNNANVHVTNTFTAGTKTFRIAHPHPSKKYTHDLVHSVIEGPQCDNIYRGKVDLVGGTATINIDTVSNMTDGTFVLLNRDIQCFTSNETGWTAVKGSVTGNILTITAQDNSCTDTISWMVVGERQDDKIKSVDTTDENGKLIMEPLTIEQTHM